MLGKRNLLLLLPLLINSACSSCLDERIIQHPPDTTCELNNPHAEFNPNFIEVCDGVDNNCNCLEKDPSKQDTNEDGYPCSIGDEGVDEGCECYPNNIVSWSDGQRKCWPDELYNRELYVNRVGGFLGECGFGKQICRELPDGGSQWGFWETPETWISNGCLEPKIPQTEICDGLDNNCDGSTDEGLKMFCWSGPSDENGVPQEWVNFKTDNPASLCKQGIKLCESGRWTGCLHEVLPAVEICDGLDNDCDGKIDDSTTEESQECGFSSVGACEKGFYSCESINNNPDLICRGDVGPTEETCNGIDDDCDGLYDEGLYKPCETDCGSGLESCYYGTWAGCTAAQPEEEVCNGLDDDCDGQVDEGLNCSCPPGLMDALIECNFNPRIQCGLGFQQCECANPDCTETVFSQCYPICYWQPELVPDVECDLNLGLPEGEKCNNWDDDCDQEVDEGLADACYTGPRGTRNVGECKDGRVICDSGMWGNFSAENIFVEDLCVDQVLPTEEVCDGIDNDCDGLIDEDLNPHEKVDLIFAIDQSGSMCAMINAVYRAMIPYVASFLGTEHKFAFVSIPGNRINNEPEVLIDFISANGLLIALSTINCAMGGIEPQYDAIHSIAANDFGLSFRADAYPMVIVVTDETAQTQHNITPQDIKDEIDPCSLPGCDGRNKLEIHAIVSEWLFGQWCLPVDIATQCYALVSNAATINSYLRDIFSNICR